MNTGILALGLWVVAPSAHAAPPIRNGGNVGIGLGGGTMVTGLDAKYWFNPSSSFQATIGLHDALSFDPDALVLGIDLDFLYEFPPLVKSDAFDLGLHLGAGGMAASGFEALDRVGAHPVLGLAAHIDAAPVDIAIDYRPTFFFIDALGDREMQFSPVEFGVHVRYWF